MFYNARQIHYQDLYLIESKNKQSDFKLEIEQIRGPFESFKGCWSLIEKERKKQHPEAPPSPKRKTNKQCIARTTRATHIHITLAFALTHTLAPLAEHLLF